MSTVVLPLPAPASSSSGPSVQNTASRCMGLSPENSSSRMDLRRALYLISNSVIYFCSLSLFLSKNHILGRKQSAQVLNQFLPRCDPKLLPGQKPLAGVTVKNNHRRLTRALAQKYLGLFQQRPIFPTETEIQSGAGRLSFRSFLCLPDLRTGRRPAGGISPSTISILLHSGG